MTSKNCIYPYRSIATAIIGPFFIRQLRILDVDERPLILIDLSKLSMKHRNINKNHVLLNKKVSNTNEIAHVTEYFLFNCKTRTMTTDTLKSKYFFINFHPQLETLISIEKIPFLQTAN